MTENEFDARMAERCGIYARSTRLPDDFADRLVGAVRRRRFIGRVRLAACILALTVVSTFVVEAFRQQEAPKSGATALVAADGPSGCSEQVSGIFFLGLVRECFRRGRISKKKEEE